MSDSLNFSKDKNNPWATKVLFHIITSSSGNESQHFLDRNHTFVNTIFLSRIFHFKCLFVIRTAVWHFAGYKTVGFCIKLIRNSKTFIACQYYLSHSYFMRFILWKLMTFFAKCHLKMIIKGLKIPLSRDKYIISSINRKFTRAKNKNINNTNTLLFRF